MDLRLNRTRLLPQLPRYIDKLTNEMKESGNLEGILLTGLTKDGVDLMESYVDRTGDVQTASFCMLKVLTSNYAKCKLPLSFFFLQYEALQLRKRHIGRYRDVYMLLVVTTLAQLSRCESSERTSGGLNNHLNESQRCKFEAKETRSCLSDYNL